MKLKLWLAPAFAALALAAPALAGAATRVVDNDGADCPNATFTSIQAAVTASSAGDTVLVCAGVYQEQVVVPAGKDGLTIRSKEPLAAVIKAPVFMTEPGDIVRINGAQDVTLRGFTIAGPLPDALFCSLIVRTGVRVDGGGSARIERNHITEIRSTSPALRGCQNGVGIQVGRNAEGQVGTATIRDNLIDLYQKNGITIDNVGSSARIEKNTVTDPGATEITAPNGIQISRGANADVRDNEVSGNVYDLAPASNGTGILLFQSGSDVTIEHNEVFDNDDGISLYETHGAKIKGNRVHDQRVFDGLFADSLSTNNLFEGNHASNNAEHDCHDDSSGSGTAGTANTWKGNKGNTENRDGLCKSKN